MGALLRQKSGSGGVNAAIIAITSFICPSVSKSITEATAGPVDIQHVLLLLTRVLSTNQSVKLSEELGAMATVNRLICDFVITRSPQDELTALDIFPTELISEIIASRGKMLTAADEGAVEFTDRLTDSLGDENCEDAKRLQISLEVQDIISELMGVIQELSSIRSHVTSLNEMSMPMSISGSPPSSSAFPSLPGSFGTTERKIVERGESSSAAAAAAAEPKTMATVRDSMGVVARTVWDIFTASQGPLNNSKMSASNSSGSSSVSNERSDGHDTLPDAETDSTLLNSFRHVDGGDTEKLLQLAKAGIGMLSQNLFGSFGFSAPKILSSSTELVKARPEKNDIIVVFVLGGISPLEVAQVQYVMNYFSGQRKRAHSLLQDEKKIILMSTDIMGPSDVYKKLFNSK